MKITYVFSFCVVLLTSCLQQDERKTEHGAYTGHIVHKAGELMDMYDGHTILPFHMVKVDHSESGDFETILISTPISKRKTVDLKEVGVFQFREEGIMKNIVVTIPVLEEWQTIDSNNFSDFVTQFGRTQNIVENWMLGRCGQHCSEKIGWKDEALAGLLIRRSIVI